jgi:hypothetical protein
LVLGLSFAKVIHLGMKQLSRRKAGAMRSYATLVPPVFFLFLVGAALWLATDSSLWIWQQLRPLSIVQFPWRWLIVPALALPWLLAWLMDEVSWSIKILLIFFVGCQWWGAFALVPADRFHHDMAYYAQFPSSTLTRNEDRPLTLSSEDLGSWQPRPLIATGSGEIVSVDSWRGLRHRSTIRAKTDIVVVEPTVFFLGWRSRIVGGGELIQIFLPPTKGLIAYRLPARAEPYVIESTFGSTPLRRVCEGASLLSLGLFAVFTFSRSQQKRNV